MKIQIFTKPTNKFYKIILPALVFNLLMAFTVSSQLANAPCNSSSAWVNGSYTNLTAGIEDNVFSIIPTCLGSVSGIANLADAILTNKTTISITGIACDATIGVKDTDSGDTYPAGTWAGYRIGSGGLLNLSVGATVTVETFNNSSAQESQVVVSSLLGLNSDLLFADGTTNVGFVSTLPFDEIRITYKALVGVLFTAEIYHPVIIKYCVGPEPTCNVTTALTQTDYPAFVSAAGTTGVTLGSVSNTANVVDADVNNFGTINLTAAILATGYIAVKAQLTTYPVGYFAGFEVSSSSVLGVDLLSNVTITTYLNGTPREVKSGNSLLLNASLLGGTGRQTIGFITTLTFNEIRFTINQPVGVTLGATNVYSAVIKKYCVAPALDCNVQTSMTEPDFPAAIEGSLTGTSGVLCTGCIVSNSSNVIDASTSNFGSITLTAGLLVNGSIAVKDVISTYPSGTFAGFDIRNSSLVDVNLLSGITIQTYLDGTLQETSNAGTLLSVNSGLLTGSNRQVVGFVTTLPFNIVRITVSQTVALDLGTTEVYKAVLQKFCQGPDPACNVLTSITSPTYPIVISNQNTGFDGLLCVGCAINNQENLINGNITDFTEIVLAVGVVAEGSISVKDVLKDYTAGMFAGFEIENTSILDVNLLNGITIRTYLNGVLKETKTGVNNVVTVGTSILTGDGKKTVGFITTTDFDEVRISVANFVGADLGTTKIFRTVIKKLCPVDLVCDKTYYISEPEFPVIINSDATGIFGVACVACSVADAPNVITSNQADFSTVTMVVGVSATGTIAVKDALSTFPAGSTAGFVIQDMNTLLQLDLFNSITLCTYLDGVEQECKSASDLIKLDLLTTILGPGPGIYNVGFKTTLPYDEVRISVGSLASVINVIQVYDAFVDTRGAFGSGFDCCPTVAPTLSNSSVSTSCPTNTFDLTSLVVGTAPGTSTVVWFTNNLHSGMAYSSPTAAVANTYYAFYYNSIKDCYSPASLSLVVAGTFCDTDGDGDPDSTDPEPTNPCVWESSQILANVTTAWRNADCDGDGVTNYNEVAGTDGDPLTAGDNTNPKDPCSLNLSQVTMVATSTGDCDGDGVTNKDEINGTDGDPLTSGDNTNPKDPCSLNLSQVTIVATSTGDCDGDGVTNKDEINGTDGDPLTSGDNTNPIDPCIYNSAQQIFANTTLAWKELDCDGDGNPNGLDPHPLVPTAVDDAITAPFGTTSTLNILVNDDFLSGTYTTLSRVSGPAGGTAGGTVSFDALTGNMIYTPLASEAGTVKTVVYEVCNTAIMPNVCSTATVTINIPSVSKILGVTFHDTDGNGIQNVGEPRIPNVNVKLYTKAGVLIGTSVSDSNGDYAFMNLDANTYYAEFEQPQGFQITFAKKGAITEDSDVTSENGVRTTDDIVLGNNQTISNIDAGYFKCVYIGDKVWNDSNNNDMFDSNENGIDGVKVILWKNHFGVWTKWDSIVTDLQINNGNFEFCSPPGQYYVEFLLPDLSLVPVLPNQGGNPNNDSDITNANGAGTTATFSVVSEQVKADLGAGFYPTAKVGNFVWHDVNQNGLQDPTEPKIEGVKVEAYDATTHQLLGNAITDVDGIYSISQLGKKDFYFKFYPPVGYSATSPTVGPDNTDSDVDHSYGVNTTRLFSMQPGVTNNNIDFGIVFGALPLSWEDIKIINFKNYHRLTWAISSESNVSHYEVERMLPNEDKFILISGEIPAKNRYNLNSQYEYLDKDLIAIGTYLYRVKSIDYDGKIAFSKIVKTSSNFDGDVVLSPNPATNFAELKLTLNSESTVSIQIYDATSRLIKVITKNQHLVFGNVIYSIDLTDIQVGMYNVSININGNVTNRKLIKLN